MEMIIFILATKPDIDQYFARNGRNGGGNQQNQAN